MEQLMLGSAPPQFQMSADDQKIMQEILPDKNVLAQFFMHAQKDDETSDREQRPAYKDVLCVLLKVQGERETFSRVATDIDKRKYPESWAQFEAQNSKTKTHLRSLPGITPARFQEFIEMGIRCVEDLAEYGGTMTDEQDKLRGIAKRVLSAIKPRFRMIDGKLAEVA